MANRILFLLFFSLILTSCDTISDYYADKEIERFIKQGGFIITDEDKKLKQKILNGIKPIRLDTFPHKLEDTISKYVNNHHGEHIGFDFVVYYNTIIQYSPDTIGYLDTNHYSVNLKIFNDNDTLETYLQYSKDLNLNFNFDY